MTRTIKAYFQTILILLSLAACTNPVPQIDEDSDVAVIVDAAVDSRSDRAQDDSADAAEAAVEASVDGSDASATEDSDASGDAQDGGNQRDSQADAAVMRTGSYTSVRSEGVIVVRSTLEIEDGGIIGRETVTPTNMTVSLFVKIRNTGANQVFFERTTQRGQAIRVSYMSSRFEVLFPVSRMETPSHMNIVIPNECGVDWCHILGTLEITGNRATAQVFLNNGAPVTQTRDLVPGFVQYGGVPTGMSIGGNVSGANAGTALLSTLVILDRVATPTERMQLRFGTFDINTALVAWRLNDNTNTVLSYGALGGIYNGMIMDSLGRTDYWDADRPY